MITHTYGGKEQFMRIVVGTDGACSGNPGPGGWGWTTEDGSLKDYGLAQDTTNQQMEIMAAARALHGLRSHPQASALREIVISSDSRYVVDCMNKKWYVGWKNRGWKTSGGSPVKNLDLWMKLLRWRFFWEKAGVTVTFEWVKGHAGNQLNEAADRLAVRGRDEAKRARL